MAITAGETLSLNALGSATGQSTKSLSAAKGNTTGPISLSSFGIDEVSSITGYTYAVENTNETYTLGFTGAGSNFSRISSRAANFTWSVASGTTISLNSNNGTSAVFSVSDRANPDGILQSISANTLRVVFNDGFNDHAAGYNTNKDKTVYSVDSYDGNSTALCLTSDSPITKADGTVVAIGDLEEGDVLTGFAIEGVPSGEENHFLNWQSFDLNVQTADVVVKNLVYSFSAKIYNINEGEVRCTSEHPFLVKDNTSDAYRFLEARRLEVGDSLIQYDNGEYNEVLITSVELEMEDVEIVSIDVEEHDTYMVNGYVTHNKGGNSHSDLTAPVQVTGASFSDPNLSWSAVSGATAYQIQIDNSSGFGSINYDYDEWSTTSIRVGRSFNSSTENISPLALPAGTWYARIRAIDHGLKGNWSSTVTINA